MAALEKVYTAEEAAEADVTVPNVTGQEVANAQVTLTRDKGLSVDVKGNGSTVVRQFPSSGTLPRGGTVTLYTEEGLADEMVTVPEVTGRDMASVEQALAAAGLNLRKDGATGSSAVIATTQDLAAGTQVPLGTVVTVSFHDPGVAAD